MCCNFCAKITWILGTNEAGGLCTLCSSTVSIHSIGSSGDDEFSLVNVTIKLSLKTFYANAPAVVKMNLESIPIMLHINISDIHSLLQFTEDYI